MCGSLYADRGENLRRRCASCNSIMRRWCTSSPRTDNRKEKHPARQAICTYLTGLVDGLFLTHREAFISLFCFAFERVGLFRNNLV